ncbi:MAG: tRNA (adenosine(37)-N6)-threonylcarbamoyltransferase complex ATPase subunit type 1 TsaE, partial [Aestuariivirgaceae bacterium]
MTFEHSWHLKTEDETAALAREFSLFATTGDWIGLTGDLGAGKTTFVRAMIRAYTREPIDVPSPTFTLVQTYDEPRVPIAHLDLYRLEAVAEADELGIDEMADNHLVLVEWADRLGERLPTDRLMIDLCISGDSRQARVTGHGSWQMRLARLVQVGRFVGEHAPDCDRQFLQGDASTRRYERLIAADGQSSLLMDMPAKTEPVSDDGHVSYSQLVHLADDISAVLAVNELLRSFGFNAPATFASDLNNGFAIVEDFGDAVFGTLENYGTEVSPSIKAAVDILADMAGREWPNAVTIGDRVHELSMYDASALETEANLLMDWFWPLVNGTEPDSVKRAEFAALWLPLLFLVQDEDPVLVMRDYHSPNLIWLGKR